MENENIMKLEQLFNNETEIFVCLKCEKEKPLASYKKELKENVLAVWNVCKECRVNFVKNRENSN